MTHIFFTLLLLTACATAHLARAAKFEEEPPFWDAFFTRPDVAALHQQRTSGGGGVAATMTAVAASPCDITGEWTGILKPTSLNATHLDDQYTIQQHNATHWSVACAGPKSCGWTDGAGVFVREQGGTMGPTVQVEFDGKGPASLLSGTVNANGKCDCIEWENDSAWARVGSLSCGAASKPVMILQSTFLDWTLRFWTGHGLNFHSRVLPVIP